MGKNVENAWMINKSCQPIQPTNHVNQSNETISYTPTNLVCIDNNNINQPTLLNTNLRTIPIGRKQIQEG